MSHGSSYMYIIYTSQKCTLHVRAHTCMYIYVNYSSPLLKKFCTRWISGSNSSLIASSLFARSVLLLFSVVSRSNTHIRDVLMKIFRFPENEYNHSRLPSVITLTCVSVGLAGHLEIKVQLGGDLSGGVHSILKHTFFLASSLLRRRSDWMSRLQKGLPSSS